MKRTLAVLVTMIAGSLAAGCDSGGGCGKDQTKVPEGGFCITVPAGYEYKGVEKKDDGHLEAIWHPSDGGEFNVDIYPTKEVPPDMKATVSHKPADTVTSGDFAGGKGKWILTVDSTKYGIFKTDVKGSKGLIECDLNASEAQMNKILSICKTISLM